MDFTNKKVLVMGLARSGLAAIKVLSKLNATIVLSESKDKQELAELQLLESLKVEIVKQSIEVFTRDYDLCIKNPGIPFDSAFIRLLKERNIPVITEIELAYLVSKPQHYIAITGTNGKTTTTTLVYELLKKQYGAKAHLCGNIGTPLCDIVLAENLMEEAGHYIALEISNFQLVNIDSFRPEIATILNLTPDHIDFMGSLDFYYYSKTLVYKNMQDGDTFLLNSDDEIISEYVRKYPVRCNISSFSLENTNADNFIFQNHLYIDNKKILPLDCIRLVGRHNLQNIMVAVSCSKKAGVSNKNIREVISSFKGVEHRLEFVREIDNIRYYNDSKATNTDATITALKSFDKGVILLVGGFEKGLDMKPLQPYLNCVKKIIGFGASGKRLVNDLAGSEGIVVDDLKQAVLKAREIAVAEDVILLSPTTSSFDQYSCFEERGKHFKEIVNSL
ncbi:MAG TPA: UDP-N-acetylmuramoyl-L-alanine--D-glutamate ligase [Erysipelotrichaceae bacterium]|nr:UDP-N-acetylmuramoyl-L-alanine--D-glutamate ligase [Erysipelotrichaceae bacterium]